MNGELTLSEAGPLDEERRRAQRRAQQPCGDTHPHVQRDAHFTLSNTIQALKYPARRAGTDMSVLELMITAGATQATSSLTQRQRFPFLGPVGLCNPRLRFAVFPSADFFFSFFISELQRGNWLICVKRNMLFTHTFC